MKKKVLFVSYFLPPFNSPQSIQVGRILKYFSCYNDYEIFVLTANQLGVAKDYTLYPDAFNNTKRVIFINDRPKNKYFKYIVNKFIPFIFQMPDEYIYWCKRSYIEVTKEFDKGFFDLILTFSFPLSINILGLKLKDYFKCSWIAFQSDPWANNHFNNYSENINKRNLQLEEKCFNLADKVVFTSKETKDFYFDRYSELTNKFCILEHTNDINLYPNKTKKNSHKKTIRYIGGFYGSRTPEPMYKAIEKLKINNRDINFVFEIYGFGRSIRKLLEKYDIAEYVSFKGSVSYLKSLELMVNADLLVLIDAPSNHKSIFFPSKLVEYIGSGSPVAVISPEGCSKRVAIENGLKYFDLHETDKIANYLENLDYVSYANKYNITDNIDKFIGLIND